MGERGWRMVEPRVVGRNEKLKCGARLPDWLSWRKARMECHAVVGSTLSPTPFRAFFSPFLSFRSLRLSFFCTFFRSLASLMAGGLVRIKVGIEWGGQVVVVFCRVFRFFSFVFSFVFSFSAGSSFFFFFLG